MKFKIIFIVLSFITSTLSVLAHNTIDSVGVKNSNGKKVILFKVKAKDTYYSIGRRYNVKAETLMKYNGSKKQTLSIGATVMVPTDIPYKGGSKEKASKKEKEAVSDEPKKESTKSSKKHKDEESDQPVKKHKKEKIPANETKKHKKARLAREAEAEREDARLAKKHKRHQAEESESPAPEVEQPVQEQAVVPAQTPVQSGNQVVMTNNSAPMQYKVSQGETLYAIAKRFSTTVEDLTQLNNLSSTTLAPGQMLMVRSGAPTAVVTTVAPIVKHDTGAVSMPTKDSAIADKHVNVNRFGLYEKNEKGVATWMDDTSLDPSKKLVLHRIAPIGTVIKITNLMTNRTTFAKVVGRFTDNESTKDAIIVVTKSVADALGAYDKRFRVSISYGSPNE